MRQIIFLLFFAFLFTSCRNNSENSLTVYRIAEEGFKRSNKTISAATDEIYRTIEDKLYRDETKVIAEIWRPKAMQVKKLSDSMVKYIEGLKQELKNEAGGDNLKEDDWLGKYEISKHVFESHGKSKELLERLVKYKGDILGIDPKINARFGVVDNYLSDRTGYRIINPTEEIKLFSIDIPVIAAYVALSKLENSIMILENTITRFCLNLIGSVDGDGMVEQYNFLVGQSSTCLRAGEILEIAAGMGAYTTTPDPNLRFDNKPVPIDENGQAVYKLKVPAIPGKYSVIIKGEFTTGRGKRVPIYNTISYTVIE